MRSFAALLGVLTLGALVRLKNFDRFGFWYDEAWVADQLMAPSWAQVWAENNGFMPELYVAVVRGAILGLGDAEWVFRLWSLMTGVGVLALVYGLSKKLSASRSAAFAATLICAVSPTLIGYSAELKPYMNDAFFCLLIALMAERFFAQPLLLRSLIAFLVVCGIALAASHPALFLVGVVMVRGTMLLLRTLVAKDESEDYLVRRRKVVLVAISIVALAVFCIVKIMHVSSFHYPGLAEYWDDVGAFPPADVLASLQFFKDQSLALLEVYLVPWPAMFLWIVMAIVVVGGNRTVLGYLFGAVFLGTVAAYLDKYPFGAPRLYVFIVPFLYMAIVTAVARGLQLFTSSPRIERWTLAALGAFAVCVSVWSGIPMIKVETEIREARDFYDQHKQPGDRVYFLTSGYRVPRYYFPDLTFNGVEAVAGSFFGREDRQAKKTIQMALQDIQDGSRIWAIFYHTGVWGDERSLTLQALAAGGCHATTQFIGQDASTHLLVCKGNIADRDQSDERSL